MRPAISLLVLAMAACSAHGANVTVVATGVMDEFYDPDGMLFFSEPPPGTEFRLTFTYDDATVDIWTTRTSDFISGPFPAWFSRSADSKYQILPVVTAISSS
jgi:hypothetical protein